MISSTGLVDMRPKNKEKVLKEALTYDDILLVPQYSDIQSRKEIDIGNNLDAQIRLSLPIISAPMDTVTGASMATTMDRAGGLGIIHRYNSIDDQVRQVIKAIGAQSLKFRCIEVVNPLIEVGAAVGVIGDFEERACALVDAGVSVVCIDVAHGHHVLVERAIKRLKDIFGDETHIMAGNVATSEGYRALSDWGADSVRCNVGGGSICTTRVQTGHGVPGLQTVMDCAQHKKDKTKIIADGGIRNSGDIVKAIAAGADFVMVGSLLAGTEEAPGELSYDKFGARKSYRGMASKEAQFEWKGEYSSNEGISTTMFSKNPSP